MRSFDSGKAAAERFVHELVEQLEAYSVERTIFVPVVGLNLLVDKLELGAVTFRVFDDMDRSTVFTKLDEFSLNRPGDENIRKANLSLKDRIEGELVGNVCAEYRVIAEPDRAWERAKEEIRRSTELINFACISMVPPESPQADSTIGMAGETPRLGPWILGVADKEVNTHHTVMPNSMPVTIGETSLIGFDQIGVTKLSEFLARAGGKTSEWEEALLRSVHWVAYARAQTERENQLLNLFTALEVLFTDRTANGITALLSESVALLIETDYTQRMELKSFISKMYGARSGISHGGNKTVTESEVRRFRRIIALTNSFLVLRLDTRPK